MDWERYQPAERESAAERMQGVLTQGLWGGGEFEPILLMLLLDLGLKVGFLIDVPERRKSGYIAVYKTPNTLYVWVNEERRRYTKG